jgi:hypothetical protein
MVLLVIFPIGINKITMHLRDPRCCHAPSTLPLSVSHASLDWSHLSASIDPLCHRPPPSCALSTDVYVAPSTDSGGHDEPMAPCQRHRGKPWDDLLCAGRCPTGRTQRSSRPRQQRHLGDALHGSYGDV